MSLDTPEGVVNELANATQRRILRRRRAPNRDPDFFYGIAAEVSFSEQVRAELRVLHGPSPSSPADARRRRRAIRNLRVGMYDPATRRRVLSREHRIVIEQTRQEITNATLREVQEETLGLGITQAASAAHASRVVGEGGNRDEREIQGQRENIALETATRAIEAEIQRLREVEAATRAALNRMCACKVAHAPQ